MRVRCEGCSHPQGLGEWVSASGGMVPGPDWVPSCMEVARRLEAAGFVHYTPCDPECDHAGPLRVDGLEDGMAVLSVMADQALGIPPEVEAAWRSIDARPNGLLCLTCAEERP